MPAQEAAGRTDSAPSPMNKQRTARPANRLHGGGVPIARSGPVAPGAQRPYGAASGSPMNRPWVGQATLRQYASMAVLPFR